MNHQEQTKCPKCKNQYSQMNLPRLLTMCGHTFCQKCIRQLMTKKKMNMKYKIICPLDKMMIQVPTPNPTAFPKNLSLLNLAKKKSQNNLTNNRLSNIDTCCHDTFGSGTTLQILQNQLQRNTERNFDLQQKNIEKTKFIYQLGPFQTCLLHQKSLQLVCVRDFQKICPSCVIFGEHRGHNVKNINQVQEMSKNLTIKLKNYLKEQKKYFDRLQSKQIQQRIQILLKNKKNELQKQITKKFKQLLQYTILVQKKTLSKLDRTIDQLRGKIFSNLNEKIIVKEKYKDWQQKLKQKIAQINSQNEEKRIKVALKSQNFIELCDKNIQIMKALELDLFDQTQKMLDNLALNVDEQEMKKNIKQYCKFQDCKNSFLALNASRVNMSQILNQQILLDDIHETTIDQSLSKPNQKQQNQNNCLNIRKIASSSVFMNMQNLKQPMMERTTRVRSSYKNNNLCSPKAKNNVLRSNKLLTLGNNKPTLTNLLRSKEVPQKYQSKIDSVFKGTTDILDLTNAQLGNELILSILQQIKDRPVAIIKLVRNKLNDQYFIKSLPFLNNIVMLNISKNQLTQRSLQHLLNARRHGQLTCLKSLMIGQNKIIQRKNKEIFDELKKLGINVCI